jgi:hypothetical protein
MTLDELRNEIENDLPIKHDELEFEALNYAANL